MPPKHICANCQHCQVLIDMCGVGSACTRIRRGYSLVTGQPIIATLNCAAEREQTPRWRLLLERKGVLVPRDRCGPGGKYFKPKEPTP